MQKPDRVLAGHWDAAWVPLTHLLPQSASLLAILKHLDKLKLQFGSCPALGVYSPS